MGGMAALTIQPDPTVAIPSQAVPPLALAIAVTAVILLILSLGLASAILDQNLASRSAREAVRLRVQDDLNVVTERAYALAKGT